MKKLTLTIMAMFMLIASEAFAPPAARLTDFHEDPLVTPVGPAEIPHVGGPVAGPGAPEVLVGGLPAAKIGDELVGVDPSDSIVEGSNNVQTQGMPSVRMGDSTIHGGTMLIPDFSVDVGE